MEKNDESRFSEARKESVVAALAATCLAIIGMVACQPVWIPRSPPASWLLQETAIVCIEVSTEQIPAVVEAIKGWDRAIGRWKRLKPQIGIVEETCNYTIRETNPPFYKNSLVLAQTNAIGGNEIELYRGRYEIDTLSIVLHELGHAFGARHMIGTLMAPHLEYRVYRCPDAATVAQVATVNMIDPTLLSWCKSY